MGPTRETENFSRMMKRILNCLVILLVSAGLFSPAWARINDIAVVVDKSTGINQGEINTVLDQLNHSFVRSGGRLSVIGVEAVVTEMEPLSAYSQSEAKALLEQLMSDHPPSSSGNVAAGIERALSELLDKSGTGDQAAIIVVSSGRINSGNTASDQSYSRWLAEVLAEKAAKANIRIDWVADARYRDSSLIQSVVKTTGGTAFFVTSSASGKGTVEKIKLPASLPATQEFKTDSNETDESDKREEMISQPLNTIPEALTLADSRQDTVVDKEVAVLAVENPAPSVYGEKQLWIVLIILLLVLVAYIFISRRKVSSQRPLNSDLTAAESVELDPPVYEPNAARNFNEILEDTTKISRFQEHLEISSPATEKELLIEPTQLTIPDAISVTIDPDEPETGNTATVVKQKPVDDSADEEDGRTVVRPLKR